MEDVNRFSFATTLQRWSLKGGLSILDQGMYSIGNFSAVVLLARWQEPRDYGAFSTAFAAMLFLGGLYNGLVLEPMSILGPSKYIERKQEYLAHQIWIHLAVSMPFAGILYVLGILIQDQMLKQAFVAASFALPFTLLILLSRRVYYTDHRPFGAFVCSLLYMLSLLCGMLRLLNPNGISSATIFLLMSFAGLIGGLPLLWRAIQYGSPQLTVTLEIMQAHWKLGVWIVSGAFFLLLGELAPFVFITRMHGLEAAGAFKAVQNFVTPMIQIQAALSLVGLPILAREFGAKNMATFRVAGLVLVAAMTGLAVIYELLLIIGRAILPGILYGGQYERFTNLIPLYGVVPILIGLFSGYFMSLRATQMKDVYLLSGLVPFAAGVPACYFLTASYGVAGAVLGVIAIQMVILLVSLWFYFFRLLKQGIA